MSPERTAPLSRAEIARRLARRRAARRRGLMRLAVLSVVLSSAAGYGISTLFGGSAGPTARHASRGAVAVESGLETWTLATPISRPVVLPAARPGEIVVAGGLLSSGASTRAVDLVNPITGSISSIGELAAAAHDAAGAVIDGRGYVFGGGSSAPSNDVQRIASSAVTSARIDAIVGRLPRARRTRKL